MKLNNLVIGMLVFGLVVTGLSHFTTDWAENLGFSLSNMSYLAPIEDIQREMKNMEESLKSSQITGTWLDIPFTVLSGLTSALKLLGTALINIMYGFISSVAEVLHVPFWVIAFFQAIVMAGIVFALLRIFLKVGEV